MPSLEHVALGGWAEVYEPAEDTFLMLDALYKDRGRLRSLQPGVVVEIGPGSGVVSSYACRLLKGSAWHLGIDVNAAAAEATVATAVANDIFGLDAVRGDLLTCCSDKSIDVVIFNPPYVTTPDADVGSDTIEASWAGGLRGRRVIDRLLANETSLKRCLADDALVYLLLSAENCPGEVTETLKTQGFQVSTLLSRGARNERLTVLRASLSPLTSL